MAKDSSTEDERHQYIFTSKGIQTYTPKSDTSLDENVSSPTPLSSHEMEMDVEEKTSSHETEMMDLEETREQLTVLWNEFHGKGEIDISQLKRKVREILDKKPKSLEALARKLGCTQSTFKLWAESPRMNSKSYIGHKLGSWLSNGVSSETL